MGFGMAELLLEHGHKLWVYDENETRVSEIVSHGAQAVSDLPALVAALATPRLIWVMVPYEAVDVVLDELLPHLAPGDVVVDGGNSPFRESMRRGRRLEAQQVYFLDVGVSGGPGGARTGACIMVGGDKKIFQTYETLFRDAAAPNAYQYMGESGAGHFVKMVHNGIEYGMMQALAEGFTLLKEAPFDLDLPAVADLYNHRSVIESRLVGWLGDAYKQFGEDLEEVSGSVAHTGEGEWTVEAARDLEVPVPIIEGSLGFRVASKEHPNYTGKILSALRNQFGKHAVRE
jgi:6-phosphogluconate dehydrogenase